MDKPTSTPKQSFVTVSSDILEDYRGEVSILSLDGKFRGVAHVVSGSGNELNLQQVSRSRNLCGRFRHLWSRVRRAA